MNGVRYMVDPKDYYPFIQELEENEGAIKEHTRFYLASKAFNHTAQYENTIANYLNQKSVHSPEFDESLNLSLNLLKQKLRYGENPHQKAAFYQTANPQHDSITPPINYKEKYYPITTF